MKKEKKNLFHILFKQTTITFSYSVKKKNGGNKMKKKMKNEEKKWRIRIFLLLLCESKILIKVSYFLFLNVVLEKLVENKYGFCYI